MKKLLLLFVAMSVMCIMANEGGRLGQATLSGVPAEVGQLKKEPWRDPTVSSINRLPARAIAVPCESEKLALQIAKGEKCRYESKYLSLLNGEWNFKWKHTFDAPKWEKEAKIKVPGCWQLQGDFDPALYTNVKYPICGYKDGDPLTTPPKDYTSFYYRNPVGLYSRTFTVPKNWNDRRVVIHFGGVSSAMYLRVNGREVGYSEDSRLPAEFDITEFLKDGENNLEVEVLKHCDGSFLEDQDFWRLSGIFRDVWLVAERKDVAKDLIVSATLSDDYKVGTLVVTNEKGEKVLEKTYDNPKLWSCEEPNMYYETIKYPGKGLFSKSDYRAVAFGFRKIEIKKSVVYINGKRVIFKGVNRHEMQPESGYAVTYEGMKKDLEICHKLNINAVRTCHYPDDPTWYELCDREGFYLVCEANVEAHGVKRFYGENPEALPANPLYKNAIVERQTNMVKVFRNHPSVIFWSLGNESGEGPAMAEGYDAIKKMDKTRPVQYEGAVGYGGARKGDYYTDIECPMYPHPGSCEYYVKNNPKRPYIMCEYAHAMGNSTGTFYKYCDLARKYPSMQGGFIWDFVDQAVWKTDSKGKWLAYGGDFGDKPNDSNFNCNGLVTATRDLHPGAYEVKHAYQPIHVDSWNWETKTLEVYNQYAFTTLKNVKGCWKVEKDGKLIARGVLDVNGIKPDTTKAIQLNDIPDGDAITFAFGREGEEEPFAYDQFTKPFTKVDMASEPSTKDIVAPLFKMNFDRAYIDNDRGCCIPRVCKVWREATEKQVLPSNCVSKLEAKRVEGGKIIVDWTFTAAPQKEGEKVPMIPRVGLTFNIPSDYTNVKWYGMGPWENYPDRVKGSMLGIWDATIGLLSGFEKDYIAPPANRLNPDNYIHPGEQGYRTGCRWIEFTNANGKKIKVTALDAPINFNAWPYTQNALEKARHQWEIKKGENITVNIDAASMGVGGDDSWNATPHAEFKLGAGTYHLRFAVEGL